jgi:hypothetical protein
MMQATVRILNSPVRRKVTLLLGIILAAGTAAGTYPTSSLADNRGDQVAPKMLRQIGVMEKIIDKVLLDSPNFLVRVDDNTRGLYIPEYGIVFTLDASLTGGSVPDVSKMIESMKNRFEVRTDKDGNQIITIKGHDKDKDKDKNKDKDKSKNGDQDSTDQESDNTPPEPPTPPPSSGETWAFSGDGGKGAAHLYAAGKEELIQALLDYGDTLTSLRGGQHVMIAAFLRDNDYFKENKIARLVLKADIDDLRAYGEGKLTEKDARSRIDIEEY